MNKKRKRWLNKLAARKAEHRGNRISYIAESVRPLLPGVYNAKVGTATYVNGQLRIVVVEEELL